jgi:hypothetical protein
MYTERLRIAQFIAALTADTISNEMSRCHPLDIFYCCLSDLNVQRSFQKKLFRIAASIANNMAFTIENAARINLIFRPANLLIVSLLFEYTLWY